MGQGVNDGISDGLRCADGGRFSHAFSPNGMVRRWRDGTIRLPLWRLHRGGDEIILEVAAVNVSFLVVIELLIERRSQTLRQTTMDLSLNDHRIDNRSAVIDGEEATNMHLSRATINVNHADVAAKRIGEVGRIVIVDGL